MLQNTLSAVITLSLVGGRGVDPDAQSGGEAVLPSMVGQRLLHHDGTAEARRPRRQCDPRPARSPLALAAAAANTALPDAAARASRPTNAQRAPSMSLAASSMVTAAG